MNFTEICGTMNREPQHVINYLQVELGTTGARSRTQLARSPASTRRSSIRPRPTSLSAARRNEQRRGCARLGRHACASAER